MAVTAIWDIKGRLDKVINYVCNPEKTMEDSLDALASLHVVNNVIEYTADQMKTERRTYVAGINCDPDIAAAQFQMTKRHWQKTDGILAFHGYQSFKHGEVDAETAHEIGVKLAQELWGDRFEVVVATHCNTGCYHNHFVLNSVSMMDGLRYYDQKKTYQRMREVSDRLCREYGLSVITEPKQRGKQYSEWAAEKNGKPTNRGIIRADIDRAITASTTWRDFQQVMQEMGYEFKTHGKSGAPLKYPALKPPDAGDYFRFRSLGEGYALEEIRERILQNTRKQVPFPERQKKPPRRCSMKGTPRKKTTGLRALYFRYCYQLHIIVKHPTSVKRVSFLLREDVRQLDRLDAETRLLHRENIRTMEELACYKSKTETRIETLTAQRTELRKELRRRTRQSDPATDEIKAEISALSSELKGLRKEVNLCDDIAQRSGQVKDNLERLNQQKELERKERETDELLRRRSGTGRAAIVGDR